MKDNVKSLNRASNQKSGPEEPLDFLSSLDLRFWLFAKLVAERSLHRANWESSHELVSLDSNELPIFLADEPPRELTFFSWVAYDILQKPGEIAMYTRQD